MNKKNEPLFHIVKRDDVGFVKTWLIRLAAICLALVVCGLLTMLLTGLNPIGVYKSMIDGAFGSVRKTWVTVQNIAILVIISLAITPSFRMKFWNIGAEGQVLVSGLAAASCMIVIGDRLPEPLLIVCMAVASMIAGAVWASIPAIFRAKWGTNETLFTLMMNYVAIRLVSVFIVIWENPKGSGTIGIIHSDTEYGWMAVGNKYLLPILVAAALTVFLYIYLSFSKHGYEISVVGESSNTAKYVGIKTGRVMIRTLALCGAMCGLAGLVLVGGVNHTLTTSLAGGRGFTAVMVSWMAQFNPFVMWFSSFVLVFFERGASQIATDYSLNQALADIVTGIVIFFIIGSEFFIHYRLRVSGNKAVKKGGKTDA